MRRLPSAPRAVTSAAGAWLRRVAQLHEDERVVAWWRARAGPALAWLTPARRRALLALGALYVGVSWPMRELRGAGAVHGPGSPLAVALVVLALFGLLWVCHRAAAAFASMPPAVRRRPQLALHLGFWGLLAALWLIPADAGTWRTLLVGLALVLPVLLWRLGYLLLAAQRGRTAGTPFRDHLLYLWPAWGGTHTPYGKGIDYLARHEATTVEALARAQLAGLKLLLLSVVWRGALALMNGAVYGDADSPVAHLLGGHSLGVPRLPSLLDRRVPSPVWLAWASLYCELVREVLRHAARGHVYIGVLRLFGFNVFRNTYKPLLAESILEFWNRYYYYFKELLVDFFFLPTFVRRFRGSPRLRIFAAIFAAAFVGNMYHHLLAQERALVQGSVRSLWYMLNSRMFYCLLLSLGLFVSMLREQRRRGRAPAARGPRVLGRLVLVWTFFGVIHIWATGTGAPFTRRTRFLLSLLGLA
jgi:hypothetical protein